CDDPMPTGNPADDGSIELCANGLLHRTGSPKCASMLPQAMACTGVGEPACVTDADCKEKPNGFCEAQSSCAGPCMMGPCGCSYGCTTDADCGSDQYCMCNDPVGRCTAGALCHPHA